MIEPVVLGITGASGSGKSYIGQALQKIYGENMTVVLQDNYYKDLSHVPLEKRPRINFDHPDAIDFELLIDHISRLKNRQNIKQPLYDFTVHNRSENFTVKRWKSIILLDGILIFSHPGLRALCDVKIFIQTPLDICFIRRLRRDINKRGRSVDSVVRQYLETVRPMYCRYVKQTKKYADLVIDGETPVQKSIEQIKNYLDL